MHVRPSQPPSRKNSLKGILSARKLEPNYLISSEYGEFFLTPVFQSTLETSSSETETSSKYSSNFHVSTQVELSSIKNENKIIPLHE